jgi:hypothetical protein
MTFERRSLWVAAAATGVVIVLAGLTAAGAAAQGGENEEPMSLSITSPAFTEGAEIPTVYTCEGDDLSPELNWSGIPDGTRSLALIVDDPDAPDPAAPKMVFVHWVLYNLPPDADGLPKDVGSDGLPAGTREGLNDWDRTGYGGPCPPIGEHRYFFKLYALDTELKPLDEPTKANLLQAIEGHVVAEAQLMGTYAKQGSR